MASPDSVWVTTPVPHDEVTVNWSAVTGAVSYEVSHRYDALEADIWTRRTPSVTNETSLTIPNLMHLMEYQVRVRAMNEDSVWSDFTTPLSIKTGLDTNFTHLDRYATNIQAHNVTPYHFDLSWDTLSNDTAGYMVRIRWEGADPYVTYYVDTNYFRLSDNLYPNQKYFVYVTGRHTYNWKISNGDTITTATGWGQPQAFYWVGPNLDGTTATVKWKPPVETTNLSGYRLFLEPDTLSSAVDSLNLSTADLNYTFSGLTDTIDYFVRIKALYTGGNESTVLNDIIKYSIDSIFADSSSIFDYFCDVQEAPANKLMDEAIPNEGAGDCSETINYAPNVSRLEETPVKTIRVAFRYMLYSKNAPGNWTATTNGWGDLKYTTPNDPRDDNNKNLNGIGWAERMVNGLNGYFENNK